MWPEKFSQGALRQGHKQKRPGWERGSEAMWGERLAAYLHSHTTLPCVSSQHQHLLSALREWFQGLWQQFVILQRHRSESRLPWCAERSQRQSDPAGTVSTPITAQLCCSSLVLYQEIAKGYVLCVWWKKDWKDCQVLLLVVKLRSSKKMIILN